MKLTSPDTTEPTHESAEQWWEALGYCWTDDDAQIVHPVCTWDELDTFEPKTQLEETAYATALRYRADALAIENEFQAAVAAWRKGDLPACLTALADAEQIEKHHGDAPGVRALRVQLLEEIEPPSPGELAVLITRDRWDCDVDDWTEYLTYRGKLEGWADFDARELAEAAIACARETQDDNGLTVDFEGLSIVSGEGTGPGTIEPYRDLPTLGALRARLDLERCGGDRWAYALDADGTRYDFDLDGGAA